MNTWKRKHQIKGEKMIDIQLFTVDQVLKNLINKRINLVHPGKTKKDTTSLHRKKKFTVSEKIP
jgi:hypothetical protein